MPLPEHVCGSGGVEAPLPAAAPCPAAPPDDPAEAVGAAPPAAAFDPAVLLVAGAEAPAVAGEPGALGLVVVLATAPAVDGFDALEPAAAPVVPGEVDGDVVDGVVVVGMAAGPPLAPVAEVAEFSGALEQAVRHNESSSPRATFSKRVFDILLSSIGGRALDCARQNTFSIEAP